MNEQASRQQLGTIRKILPGILRITLGLILWTLGMASMNLVAALATEHRAVKKFGADRSQVEALQRWVNGGHDPWCIDPQLVAAAMLSNISPEADDAGPASLTPDEDSRSETRVAYSFYSLDGLFTYRVTLRRFDWLLPIAGSFEQMIWVPETAEITWQETPIESKTPQRFDIETA